MIPLVLMLKRSWVPRAVLLVMLVAPPWVSDAVANSGDISEFNDPDYEPVPPTPAEIDERLRAVRMELFQKSGYFVNRALDHPTWEAMLLVIRDVFKPLEMNPEIIRHNPVLAKINSALVVNNRLEALSKKLFYGESVLYAQDFLNFLVEKPATTLKSSYQKILAGVENGTLPFELSAFLLLRKGAAGLEHPVRRYVDIARLFHSLFLNPSSEVSAQSRWYSKSSEASDAFREYLETFGVAEGEFNRGVKNGRVLEAYGIRYLPVNPTPSASALGALFKQLIEDTPILKDAAQTTRDPHEFYIQHLNMPFDLLTSTALSFAASTQVKIRELMPAQRSKSFAGVDAVWIAGHIYEIFKQRYENLEGELASQGFYPSYIENLLENASWLGGLIFAKDILANINSPKPFWVAVREAVKSFRRRRFVAIPDHPMANRISYTGTPVHLVELLQAALKLHEATAAIPEFWNTTWIERIQKAELRGGQSGNGNGGSLGAYSLNEAVQSLMRYLVEVPEVPHWVELRTVLVRQALQDLNRALDSHDAWFGRSAVFGICSLAQYIEPYEVRPAFEHAVRRISQYEWSGEERDRLIIELGRAALGDSQTLDLVHRAIETVSTHVSPDAGRPSAKVIFAMGKVAAARTSRALLLGTSIGASTKLELQAGAGARLIGNGPIATANELVRLYDHEREQISHDEALVDDYLRRVLYTHRELIDRSRLEPTSDAQALQGAARRLRSVLIESITNIYSKGVGRNLLTLASCIEDLGADARNASNRAQVIRAFGAMGDYASDIENPKETRSLAIKILSNFRSQWEVFGRSRLMQDAFEEQVENLAKVPKIRDEFETEFSALQVPPWTLVRTIACLKGFLPGQADGE